ncbi:glycosyltransferase family 2 protein [Actinoplanes awajinensis]|uniref:Glycosyltransferase 2-like domain-containing protein n=1 Tax=Actinoplanes awajinensis subsp. mycoplanecinus TaxID=135947 RepID=A0A124GAM6_9ACTN|nr:glycosyltransferase family 2 protein [Actinoplanes awajinensis]KUL32710.1 hypothetical protein ADL15_19550 [Actinoplanes awajinensis subsp. mycoplanecinus]
MSIVIPAGTAALPVLLAALPPVAEVIVVVGRDDDTTATAPRAARVIRQTRTGVGNALACGVAASTGDIVITLAGDGSCDPAEIPRYLRALQDGADVAQGSRFRLGGRDLSGGRASQVNARVLLWFMTVLFGCRRTDPGFGFRAFWRDVAGTIGLPRVAGVDPVRGDGAEIEALLTVRAGANGLFVTEVPAVAYPRTARAARAGLVPAVAALVAERRERGRVEKPGQADSIVVMTGQALDRTGTDAAGLAARWPSADPRTAAADQERLGFGQFGGFGSGTPPVQRSTPPVQRTLSEATTVRRRWRDNQGTANGREVGAGRRRLQGRPNLRVINGEGGGGGGRTGQLRAVPPVDPDR